MKNRKLIASVGLTIALGLGAAVTAAPAEAQLPQPAHQAQVHHDAGPQMDRDTGWDCPGC